MPSERLARLEACQEQTKSLVQDMHSHLVGKPGSDGIVTRIAKVEQRQSLFVKITATIGSAIVALGVWLVKGKM